MGIELFEVEVGEKVFIISLMQVCLSFFPTYCPSFVSPLK
jgi:hypothetical protein